MKIQGIRILDKKDKILIPTLSDILDEIGNSSSLYWCILGVDGTINQTQCVSFFELVNKINNSAEGKVVSFQELINISNAFYQMFEARVLGSKDIGHLKRYSNEGKMYETCNIVIDLIDCVCWEVFAKDKEIIERLAKRFKQINYLQFVDDKVLVVKDG